MNDVKTWRALCSHWNTSPYDLECGLRAACDRIEALERENAAMRHILALYDTRSSRKLGCHSVDGHGTSGRCDCHDKELAKALAALAPATSKETP